MSFNIRRRQPRSLLGLFGGVDVRAQRRDVQGWVFAERRCAKCQARILAHNEASLALHRRLGFIEDGRLRDHVFFAGR
ncbi:GNAT family N-acetyltransferase [Streptomyces sp. NPDC020965]|uniref:GNAT family N-acetyltransferase n=1 Tax=Streptomyces sp. NPDC020965 TaxID=3365105 RepID=UPI00379C1814